MGWLPGPVRRALPRVFVVTAAAAGVGSLYLYREYQDLLHLQKLLREANADADPNIAPKRQVLTIPFDRLKLVQRPQSDMSEWIGQARKWIPVLLGRGEYQEDDRITIDVPQLVHLLHTAANDPCVCALMGRFGAGGVAGLTDKSYAWADVEEIRNALTVFAQSHRRHSNPNLQHEMIVIPRIKPKPMYCYADSFLDLGGGSLMTSGNVNYYLASVFTHVHLQKHGELGLLGIMAQNFFFRGFLEKYGIQMHVFKHGDYKTATNAITERGFNRAHKRAVENMVNEIDADLSLDMMKSRGRTLMRAWVPASKGVRGGAATLGGSPDAWNSIALQIWNHVHEAGFFPSESALGAGLVDFLPRRDPLPDLLAYNRANTEEEKKKIKDGWETVETDFGNFPAEEAISLQQYAAKQRKLKRLEEKRTQWEKRLTKWFGQDALSIMPSVVLKEQNRPIDEEAKQKKGKVLLMNISGMIDDTKAREVVKDLRKATAESLPSDGQDEKTSDEQNGGKSEIKCIVLRITSPGGSALASETISQELQALKIPFVVSMGNVAASGGYYIAAHADRIFASNKTLTGSIGVYAVRADLTKLAEKYGITTDYVATGSFAGVFDAFSPMTRGMQQGVSDAIDRSYQRFKSVVQDGRNLKSEDVEELAQGKVWSGRQAKEIGLVDEIGGLTRALAYAKRTYCATSVTDDLDQFEVVTEVGNDKKKTFQKMFKAVLDPNGKSDSEKNASKGDPYSSTTSSDGLWQLLGQFLGGLFSVTSVEEEDDSTCLFPTLNGLSATQKFCHGLTQSDKAMPGVLSSGVLLAANENVAVQLLLRDYYQSKLGQSLPLSK